MAKVYEYSTEVLVIFFNTMIQSADMLLVEKAQNFLLQSAATFAGDDLNERNLLVNCFLNDAVEFSINKMPLVVYVVQIQL